MLDVVIINLAVHGGAFHKLIFWAKQLNDNGLKTQLLLSTEMPMGLQKGIDFEDHDIERLYDRDNVFLGSHSDIFRHIKATRSKLYIFDHSRIPFTKVLVNYIKNENLGKTAQIGFLWDDFCYWGVEYVLLPHPITLWFILTQRRSKDAFELVNTKKIYFVGNLLYYDICNEWTNRITNRKSLCAKYSLDDELPICLWLPDRLDGQKPIYGQIIKEVKSFPMNLLVKLHPWEYKNLKHGFDSNYRLGTTSADRWGVSAIEEKDGSWAMRFCDIAVASGSSIGLEMPFWGKPTIYITKPHWITNIARDSICRTRKISKLKYLFEAILNESKVAFDFCKTKTLIDPYSNSSHMSIRLHTGVVKEILDESYTDDNITTGEDLANLYEAYIPMTKGWSGGAIKCYWRHWLRQNYKKIKQGLSQAVN